VSVLSVLLASLPVPIAHLVHASQRVVAKIELTDIVALPAIAHIVVLAIVNSRLVQFPDVLHLTLVHVCKIAKNGSLGLFACENFKHFASRMGINSVTVLTLNDLLSLGIVESAEMLVVDVFDIDPFDFEIALEFQRMVLPPEGEGLLMVA
jgi:hypothetical protein